MAAHCSVRDISLESIDLSSVSVFIVHPQRNSLPAPSGENIQLLMYLSDIPLLTRSILIESFT